MNTRAAWLMVTSWRNVTGSAVLGLLPVLGGSVAWAQTETAPSGQSARRHELRSIVRQPQAALPAAGGKAVEQRHLTAEERSQLRRQLTRELRAQNAALADASRP
jgi:hypothetical protein